MSGRAPAADVGGLIRKLGPDDARSAARLPIPTWLLLAALVGASALFRFLLAARDPAPWIFADEIAYSELAKSLASSGEPALRDVSGTHGFGLVYPLLIAPAYLLFDAIPSAYDAVRFINSVVMSLTAIPAYLLTRRLASPALSLSVAALAVGIPSLGYTGAVVPQNAFYPLCALWLLLLVLALERPTVARQLALLGVLAVAFLTHAHAVSLVAVIVGAVAISAVLEARADRDPLIQGGARRVASFWPTWLGLGVTAAVVIVGQVARDEAVGDVLGASAGVTSIEYDVGDVLDWMLLHLGAIDIVVGIFPFAAFLLLAGFVADRPRDHDRALRAFVAAGVSFVLVLTAVAAAYASGPAGQRIEERHYFYVVPVFFAALAAWIQRGAPRPWPAVAWALIPAVVLPARIPFESFLNDVATQSTLGFLPLWRIQHKYLELGNVPEAVFVAAVLAAALFALIPRRLAWLLPVVILVYYAGTFRMIEGFTHEASVEAARAGVPTPPRDWIDRAVGRDAGVAALWRGGAVLPMWELEFFNRSVGRVYTVGDAYDSLPSTQVRPRRLDGLLRDLGGRPGTTEYVLTDRRADVGGSPVAHDRRTDMALYETLRTGDRRRGGG